MRAWRIKIRFKLKELEQTYTIRNLGIIVSTKNILDGEITTKVKISNSIYNRICNNIIGKKEISTNVEPMVRDTKNYIGTCTLSHRP